MAVVGTEMVICPGVRSALTRFINPAEIADAFHVMLYLFPPFAAFEYDRIAEVVPRQMFGITAGVMEGSGLTFTVTTLEGNVHE